MSHEQLTIICPVFNEEAAIPLFVERIRRVREQLSVDYDVHLLFCNNASTDGSLALIERIRATDTFIFVVTLSRNVGYQRSIECGLRNAKGTLFVIIDVDCEDPPEMILDFVAKHREGYDVVYGERVDREEAAYVKWLRKVFYRVTRWVADENIILDMAEFSLMTSEVRDAITQDQTSFPFIRASIARVGFDVAGIPYKRHARIAGDTHYNFVRMTVFAVAGILSSSTLLLRLPVYILPLWIAALVGIAIATIRAPEPWLYVTLALLTALYIGATCAFLAIYVARIYRNSLGRPNAIIRHRGTHLQP